MVDKPQEVSKKYAFCNNIGGILSRVYRTKREEGFTTCAQDGGQQEDTLFQSEVVT